MVAGVVLPQNPNSAPFRFSLGYHNITIPGDRSHHAPVPKHVIIDRDKDDNEYYTRLFAKEQSYRSMLRILGYWRKRILGQKIPSTCSEYEKFIISEETHETKEKIYSDNAFSNNHIIVAVIWDHEMLSFV